jgi:hypothetical protein
MAGLAMWWAVKYALNPLVENPLVGSYNMMRERYLSLLFDIPVKQAFTYRDLDGGDDLARHDPRKLRPCSKDYQNVR